MNLKGLRKSKLKHNERSRLKGPERRKVLRRKLVKWSKSKKKRGSSKCATTSGQCASHLRTKEMEKSTGKSKDHTKQSLHSKKSHFSDKSNINHVALTPSAVALLDNELDLYSMYSSGCVTRGQVSRVKQMLSESNDSLHDNRITPGKICTRSSSLSNVDKTQIDVPSCSSGGETSKLKSINSFKSFMKRKHEALNETPKSPEKKTCRTSLGSVIATRTAVLPTANDSELRPLTRRRSLLSAKSSLSNTSDASIHCDESKNPNPLSPNSTKATPLPDGTEDWLQRFLRWNATDKIHVLDRLIGVCQPHEVRHMLEVIEPQFQRDFISLLPKELALYVLSFLEPRDLLVSAQTCRYWRILAEDDLMWREKCLEEGISERRYTKVPRGGVKGKKGCGVGIGSSWKAAFLRQVRIETNWRTGSKKPSKLLKGHDDHVITCLQFNGSRIVSGSDDNTLKVWSAVSGKCLRTLTGHTGGVWASQMQHNLIISGSTDRTLKIWNSDTGQCVHTLYGHTSTVRCLALHGRTVVSGSRDATLRVWNIDSGACEHVLIGHMAAVRCVCYDGSKVVSGAYDYMVKVWDPASEECLHTLQGHTNRVYSLQFDGAYVVSGSLDTSIRVWEVESGTCLHTLMGHQSLTSGMELKDNILVSGNADSTVKIWDIKSGECLKTLEGPNKHLSAVTCLQFHGKFVITSSDDGTVKLWDVKSGKVVRDLVSLDSRGSGGVVWRIRASRTKLVCAVGSRNGTEETKLLVLDFDYDGK